ncbi:hypothetical protein BDW_13790 [Bdellovibrio bacteriovorus W]|nr:hypothetical protein BDW_13790 [Bdellovibrio bacteriovorus W]
MAFLTFFIHSNSQMFQIYTTFKGIIAARQITDSQCEIFCFFENMPTSVYGSLNRGVENELKHFEETYQSDSGGAILCSSHVVFSELWQGWI